MTISSASSPTAVRRSVAGVVLLVLGIVAGVVSVHADSRAGCATWVTLALLLTLGAGLLLGTVRAPASRP